MKHKLSQQHIFSHIHGPGLSDTPYMPAPTDVRKSLLIIKSQANSIRAVEQFLGNREWRIHATTNLKEALTYLVSQKPSFVMISIDHPNKKVRSLPKILSQAFPVFVMVYSESNTTAAYKNLLESGGNYRINPPATGPAVERTIHKILRDQDAERERLEREKLQPRTEGALSPDIQTFEGGRSGAGSAATLIQGGSASFGADSNASTSLSEILRQMSEAGEGEGAEASFLASAASGEAPRFGVRPDGTAGAGAWVPMDPEASPKALKDSAAVSSSLKGLVDAPPLARSREEESEPGSFEKAAGTETGTTPAAGLLRKKSPPGPESADSFDTSSVQTPLRPTSAKTQGWERERESIMVRGTQSALDQSVDFKDGQVLQKVEDSSNVACLIVESPRFSGYLVAALGKNRRIDEKFIATIRERLFKFLKDAGEAVSEEGAMNLKIKKVDFEDWALEYAEFLRKSVHGGEEIAMAFFPFARAKTEIGDSASVEMGSIAVEEISADISLDFNLYIYLPANQRYVLYTPRGSKFYSSQKERLSEMGVSHIHVKRAELQDVDKYRAQNYLNSKIDEFQNRKKGRLPHAA